MPHMSPMNWMLLFFIFWSLLFIIQIFIWWNSNLKLKFNTANTSSTILILPW